MFLLYGKTPNFTMVAGEITDWFFLSVTPISITFIYGAFCGLHVSVLCGAPETVLCGTPERTV
jgi:hypothetical protein